MAIENPNQPGKRCIETRRHRSRLGTQGIPFPAHSLQFGGLPPLTQGIEGFNCRNEDCEASAEDDEWTPEGLRVLAAGREDSDFPMVTRDGSNPFVQVVALICPECLGLRVVNQCD